MKKLLVILALLSATPASAACVMGLEGADRAIAQHRMTKHVLTEQRLLAFVDLMRERIPQYALEEDTTAIWLIEIPEAPVGLIIEVNDKCVTFKPEEAPIAAIRGVLIEISKRVVGA